MSKPLPSPLALSGALVAALAACGWFEDPTPENVRFRASGSPGAAVEVVYSTQFVAAVDGTGVTHVSLAWADTLRQTLPIDTTVYIGIARRFFVEIRPIQPDPLTASLAVDVDGRVQVSERGTVRSSTPWRYAYLFNQRVTRILDTTI